MILDIYGYGHKVLMTKAEEVDQNDEGIDLLIGDMWETMKHAQGCGLAAPQVGKSLQLFVVDSKGLYSNIPKESRDYYFPAGENGIRETFINPKIIKKSAKEWRMTEGCLSLPLLSGQISRPWSITIEYFNQNWERKTETFNGLTARIILHEYDHIHGRLYIDRLTPLSKKLIKSKLKKVFDGQVVTYYKMKFKN